MEIGHIFKQTEKFARSLSEQDIKDLREFVSDPYYQKQFNDAYHAIKKQEGSHSTSSKYVDEIYQYVNRQFNTESAFKGIKFGMGGRESKLSFSLIQGLCLLMTLFMMFVGYGKISNRLKLAPESDCIVAQMTINLPSNPSYPYKEAVSTCSPTWSSAIVTEASENWIIITMYFFALYCITMVDGIFKSYNNPDGAFQVAHTGVSSNNVFIAQAINKKNNNTEDDTIEYVPSNSDSRMVSFRNGRHPNK